MGIEIEVQDDKEYKEIRSKELQLESVSKLNQVTDMVDNINIETVEENTEAIKQMVINNLEKQANIDDVVEALGKVAQGISDIKRNQTNLNKKLNQIQEQIGE